jgi:flagellar biosynthesis protein FliQ
LPHDFGRAGGVVTEGALIHIVREALYLVLMVSLPLLAVSLVVCLATGVVQMAAHVQEPALSVVPRLVLVLLALVVAGGWIGGHILDFGLRLWHLLAAVQL